MISPAALKIRRSDDRGSLPLALLLTLVGTVLSAALVPVVLSQINDTKTEVRRGNALAAAQSGLDAALGHLRAATDSAGNGEVAALPCGPLTGRVAAAGGARYQVTIEYYPGDPKNRPADWLAANRIACGAGAAGPAALPAFALLRSIGTDRATGDFDSVPTRALRATYPVRSAADRARGGLVRVYRTGGEPELCLDAGGGSPAAGTVLRVRDCVPTGAGSAAQRFTYSGNLALQLASSRTPASPLGLCLDAGAPQAIDRPVQLQPCGLTTQPRQQWFYTDSGNFEGTADGTVTSGYCFTVETWGAAGSAVVLGGTAAGDCRQGYLPGSTFLPEALVGAGAAGPPAGQLVNFGQFSRCVTVTDQDLDADYLIAGVCEQSPDPTAVTWSQRWAIPAVPAGATDAAGPITTAPVAGTDGPDDPDAADPPARFCLRSPGSTDPGRYVTVVPCPPGEPAPDLRWTVRVGTADPATSYRIEDSFGNCLAPTDPAALPADLHPDGYRISKLVVARCGGDPAQKWNAPPVTVQSPALLDLGER